VLYPKEGCSPNSGISSELLCRGRDFVVCPFYYLTYKMQPINGIETRGETIPESTKFFVFFPFQVVKKAEG